MSKLADLMNKQSTIVPTENGGKSYSTTGNALINLFANIGGMRERDEADIINLWLEAREEDKNLADNIILYARDIRNGGLGERRIGRLLLKQLAIADPSKVKRNFDTIVSAGRWDDLLSLEETPAWSEAVAFIKQQIDTDLESLNAGKPISVCAKWLPSINASSKETKRLAHKLCTMFGMNQKTYRKTLVRLRNYLRIVETSMSSNQWENIEFATVPSVAMNRYKDAFHSHCSQRFEEYLLDVAAGKQKINSSTLYPYDIVRNFFTDKKLTQVDEEQWKALPNFLENEQNIVFVADVSGSMTADSYRPLSTSIGLAIYFAQRNKGDFHNLFMTFSEEPKVEKIEDGWTLEQCVRKVTNSDWGMSTDLDKTFELVYQMSIKAQEAPAAICIVSDMEIDCWSDEEEYDSITQKWQNIFEEAGLSVPKLVYWNVLSRSNRVLSSENEKSCFVSGYGVGSFRFFQTLVDKSAYEAVVEILSKQAFQWK